MVEQNEPSKYFAALDRHAPDHLVRGPRPPPLPPGFPRRDWSLAQLAFPIYKRGALSCFEAALAAKKASMAWIDARDNGNWQDAQDRRWFILAVADRAQQRKAHKSLELKYDGLSPRTTEEWDDIIHAAVADAYMEATATQEYPAEHTPTLEDLLPLLCNLVALDIYSFSSTNVSWPYPTPLTTDDLGHFAPQRGDPEVLLYRWKYPKTVTVTESLRDSCVVILDWTVAENGQVPPLPPPYESLGRCQSASEDEPTTACTGVVAPVADATDGIEALTIHDEGSAVHDEAFAIYDEAFAPGVFS